MTGRRLTPQERALWRSAMRDVNRTACAGEAPAMSGDCGVRSPTPLKAPAPLLSKSRTGGAVKGAPIAPHHPNVFSAGDPGFERRVRRGRMAVERAIDLHGMTQRAAHSALLDFIGRARAEGRRCVLVVTGKGSSGPVHPLADRAPRGVIRTRFREWVNEPVLRSAIVRVSPAHPRDGGGGAFYVFLKKKTGAHS